MSQYYHDSIFVIKEGPICDVESDVNGSKKVKAQQWVEPKNMFLLSFTFDVAHSIVTSETLGKLLQVAASDLARSVAVFSLRASLKKQFLYPRCRSNVAQTKSYSYLNIEHPIKVYV